MPPRAFFRYARRIETTPAMTRLLPFLLGPELYWIVVCLAMQVLGRTGGPARPEHCSTLDDHWGWLPFVVVPLTFVCFFVAGPGRWWLLLRIDLAIAVGCVVAAWQFCNAMTYHNPSSGPGAGMAFMVIPMFGAVLAFIATVIAAIVIWWRSRAGATPAV